MTRILGLFSIIICYLFFNHSVLIGEEVNVQKTIMTIEQAIEKGRKKLRNIGLDSENLSVKADENNTAWKDHIASDAKILESDSLKRMNLSEKIFWAIYFSSDKLVFGGDAWVFVDKNDGAIIGVILGE